MSQRIDFEKFTYWPSKHAFHKLGRIDDNIQGVLKILPDSKDDKIFWTMSVI